jgi:hypothetical protein
VYPPRLHGLAELARRAEMYDQMTESQRQLLDTLDPLNIECRYPSEKERLLASLSQERCLTLVGETRELLQWITRQLLNA